MRTCTGCRAVEPQSALVRVAFDGPGLVLDRERKLPGRGAYVHSRVGCVTVAGLAKSLRRAVSVTDVQQVAREFRAMSRNDDNSSDRQQINTSGLGHADAVETSGDLNPGIEA
ncbi:MAG: YlxR family protein [Kofleriaceae bacterium]